MKKNLKLSVIAVMLVALLGVCLAGTTFSYFTDAHAQGGVYNVSGVKTTITEETEGWQVKKPSVTNVGENDCYVRMRYEISQNGLVTVNAPAAGWTLGDDGWYYYAEPLAPGEASAPLFDTVAIGEAYLDEEGTPPENLDQLLAHLRISLYQEAVQAELTFDGTTYTDADEIWALYEAGFINS